MNDESPVEALMTEENALHEDRCDYPYSDCTCDYEAMTPMQYARLGNWRLR